jgi:hypothetical protein
MHLKVHMGPCLFHMSHWRVSGVFSLPEVVNVSGVTLLGDFFQCEMVGRVGMCIQKVHTGTLQSQVTRPNLILSLAL